MLRPGALKSDEGHLGLYYGDTLIHIHIFGPPPKNPTSFHHALSPNTKPTAPPTSLDFEIKIVLADGF